MALSEAGRQRCAEAARKRMQGLTAEERSKLAGRFGESTLRTYGSGHYAAMGRKSASLRKIAAQQAAG